MAVVSKVYGNAPGKLANKEVNWLSDTIKVMLCTSSYVPDQDAHIYKSSVTNEVVGTGYTARGQALATKTATYTGATNTMAFSAATTVWTSSTLTARYAIVYEDTASDATSTLLCYVDFGADVISSGGSFTITWDPAGIITAVSA